MQGSNNCGAKTRSGEPCENASMLNGRCRIHGGKSLKGIASPKFVNGRHSKYMPQHLLPRYLEALNDPELLNLQSDIALVESRLTELLQVIPNNESSGLWTEVKSNLKILGQGLKANNQSLATQALDTLTQLTQEGTQEWRTWNEIDKLLSTKRKLIESERSRLQQMNQYITTEQAMIFAAAVTDAVKRNVKDRDTLTAITHELAKLSL